MRAHNLLVSGLLAAPKGELALLAPKRRWRGSPCCAWAKVTGECSCYKVHMKWVVAMSGGSRKTGRGAGKALKAAERGRP